MGAPRRDQNEEIDTTKAKPGGRWRWVVVFAAIALLAALPLAVANIPVRTDEVDAARLIEMARSSSHISYRGYAESAGTLPLPDVPQAGRVADLFAQTTRMRIWFESPDRWRVDELLPAAERAQYFDPSGMWLWDSARTEATRVTGHPPVHLPRAFDLLPSSIGRLVADAAQPGELEALGARRVAGVTAPGVRVSPLAEDSTIDRVDMWVAPRSGLPLQVEVWARYEERPVLRSTFLDLDFGQPHPRDLTFKVPRRASLNERTTTDFAQQVNEESPYRVPDVVAGLQLRTRLARSVAIYGDGFDRFTVLALPTHLSPERAEVIRTAPPVTGAWGTGHVLETALVNTMFFTDGDVSYIVSGMVTVDLLERAASDLADNDGSGT